MSSHYRWRGRARATNGPKCRSPAIGDCIPQEEQPAGRCCPQDLHDPAPFVPNGGARSALYTKIAISKQRRASELLCRAFRLPKAIQAVTAV